MDLRMQRRLAADILKVGTKRVWIDPDWIDDVSSAITREDVRKLINDGAIKARPKKSISKGRTRKRKEQLRKGRRKGPGRRKGAKKARVPKQDAWIKRVRPLRRKLHKLRDEGAIDSRVHHKIYRMIKGGSLRSKAHLESYLKERGILEE